MRLTRTVPPAAPPLDLDEVKRHLRVDGDEEDLVILGILNAAVDHLDGYSGILGRCLVTQTWRAEITRLGESIALPFPDSVVTQIVYTDAPLGPVEWVWHESLARPTLIPLGGWGRPVTVTFTAGYGGPGAVPHTLKQAILLLADHWYNNRGAVGEAGEALPLSFDTLIAPHRVRRL